MSLQSSDRAVRVRPMKHGHYNLEHILNKERNLKDKFCHKPFDQFEIFPDGSAFVCCMARLPTKIGNVQKNTIEEVHNSEIAQKIRQSVLDGTFKYCNRKTCPDIQNNSLSYKENVNNERYKKIILNNITKDIGPIFFNLCYDESCNLSCPSCRVKKINYFQGAIYEQTKQIQNKIIEYVFNQPHNRHYIINVAGSGDPFGSKIYRELLFNIDGSKYPKVFFNLQTNGVMFTPSYWDRMKKIQKNIYMVMISIDAATEKAYNITRRGGSWKVLMSNLMFLSKLRRKKLINKILINFVVQQANYKEMPEFIKLGKRLMVDMVYFSLVADWGTWDKEEYNFNCIWGKTHPEYNNFLEVMKDPIFSDSIVNLGNLTDYRKYAHDLS